MTKKNKKHIVIATAIIILVVALLIYRYYIPDMKPKKQFTPAAVEYAYDDAELQDAIKRVGKGYQIQRYKGLGEMDPAQLWETTMDPSTRSMMQVTVEDAAEAERMITVLMGDQLEERKRYIAEHANFNKEDTFIKEVKL